VQGSQLIVAYDEHEVNNTFKFGVIYQKFGQVSDLVSELLSIYQSSATLAWTWIHLLCLSLSLFLWCACGYLFDFRGTAVWEQ